MDWANEPGGAKPVSSSVRSLLSGKIHEAFTVAADQLIMRGYLTREQRIALSGLIGDMLKRFEEGLQGEDIGDAGYVMVDASDAGAIANKGTLTVFKQADGRWRWVGITSTAYRDRDGEIVSTKALEDDVARADAEGNYGPLRWWHIKGADFGDCDFNALYGKTLIESGTFRDERDGPLVAAKAADLEFSIGFNHPPDQPDTDGIFHSIRRFERSLLPKGTASNRFTRLTVTRKEQEMDNDKRSWLERLLGKDRAEQVLAEAETTQKEAEAEGVAFKEATEEAPVVTPPPPAVEEAAPTPAPDITALVKAEVEAAFASFSQTVKEAAAKEEEERTKAATRLTSLEADLTTTKATLTQTQAALKEAAAKIAELEGETPRSVRGFRASTSDDTLMGTNSTVKGLVPEPDPAAEFIEFLVPGSKSLS